MPHKAPKLGALSLVVQPIDFLSFISILPDIVEKHGLQSALNHFLPNCEKQWREQKLPWEDIYLDQWLAWLKVDQGYGSAILDVLIS